MKAGLLFCLCVLMMRPEMGATASGTPPRVKVVSYNMAAGASRDSSKPLLDKKQSFYRFSREFAGLYDSDPDAHWIICVQEILRDDQNTWYYHNDDKSRNQVDMLQQKLNDFTGVYWYTAFHQLEASPNKEAVAIFSTAKILKTQTNQWMLAPSRPAVAVKVDLDPGLLWVVNVHLVSDLVGDQSHNFRKDSVVKMRQNIATFDPSVPVVVAGDFNVHDPGITTGARAGNQQEFDETVNLFIGDGYTRGVNFSASKALGTAASYDGYDIGIIDYVLLDEKDGVCAMQESSTLDFTISNGYHASDHRGVITEILFLSYV